MCLGVAQPLPLSINEGSSSCKSCRDSFSSELLRVSLCVCVCVLCDLFFCFFDLVSGAKLNDVPDGDTPCNGALLALSQRRGESSLGANNVRLLLRPTS